MSFNDLSPTRRRFLVASGLGASGLTLGFHVPSLAQSGTEAAEVNAWVVVQPDDTCLVRVARAEMGQGTHTGLAMLVAEELECDWARVKVQPITPGQNLARKRVWRDMSTGGSRGIRGSHDYVRQGGAAARLMLLQAAANQWSVPVTELTVDKGVITHTPTRRQLRYGQVAVAASKLTPPDPKTITLKSPKDWKIAGKPMKRLDTAERVTGQIKYGIDTALPGMLYAAITDSPVFGGKLVSFDADKVRSRRGVKGVVRVDASSVAVVADSWWRAKMALQDLPIVWDEGPNARESSAAIAQRLKAGLTATQEVFADINVGNAQEAIAKAARQVEAVYSTPFVSHACMEPMNCTARVNADRAEVWVSSQNAEASLAALSAASGLPLDKCEAWNPPLGGGFGRRGGTQDGKALVDPAALAELFKGSDANPAYGLTWWLPRASPSDDPVTRSTDIVAHAPTLPADLVVAAGAGDQRLYVIPSRRLTIVRQARLDIAALAAGKKSGWSDTHFLSFFLSPTGE